MVSKKMIPEHGMMIPVCFVWLGFDRWLRTTKQMIVSVGGPAVYLLYPTGKRWKRPTNSNDSSSWQKIKITRSSVKSVQCCLWISDFSIFLPMFQAQKQPQIMSGEPRNAWNPRSWTLTTSVAGGGWPCFGGAPSQRKNDEKCGLNESQWELMGLKKVVPPT